MELVTIDRFLFIADAEIARATLEAAGIDAVLVDENIVRMSWGDAQAHGGVRLQVRAEDVEEAESVIQWKTGASPVNDWTSTSPDNDWTGEAPVLHADEVCSRCGSDEIFPVESRVKTFARTLLLTWIAFMLINLANCGLHLQQTVIGIAYALALIGPAFAIVFTAVAPRKRCRNCGLEWRGKPRTS
jgi:hypothetical protein